jgi:hypothetical protein
LPIAVLQFNISRSTAKTNGRASAFSGGNADPNSGGGYNIDSCFNPNPNTITDANANTRSDGDISIFRIAVSIDRAGGYIGTSDRVCG